MSLAVGNCSTQLDAELFARYKTADVNKTSYTEPDFERSMTSTLRDVRWPEDSRIAKRKLTDILRAYYVRSLFKQVQVVLSVVANARENWSADNPLDLSKLQGSEPPVNAKGSDYSDEESKEGYITSLCNPSQIDNLQTLQTSIEMYNPRNDPSGNDLRDTILEVFKGRSDSQRCVSVIDTFKYLLEHEIEIRKIRLAELDKAAYGSGFTRLTSIRTNPEVQKAKQDLDNVIAFKKLVWQWAGPLQRLEYDYAVLWDRVNRIENIGDFFDVNSATNFSAPEPLPLVNAEAEPEPDEKRQSQDFQRIKEAWKRCRRDNLAAEAQLCEGLDERSVDRLLTALQGPESYKVQNVQSTQERYRIQFEQFTRCMDRVNSCYSSIAEIHKPSADPEVQQFLVTIQEDFQRMIHRLESYKSAVRKLGLLLELSRQWLEYDKYVETVVEQIEAIKKSVEQQIANVPEGDISVLRQKRAFLDGASARLDEIVRSFKSNQPANNAYSDSPERFGFENLYMAQYRATQKRIETARRDLEVEPKRLGAKKMERDEKTGEVLPPPSSKFVPLVPIDKESKLETEEDKPPMAPPSSPVTRKDVKYTSQFGGRRRLPLLQGEAAFTDFPTDQQFEVCAQLSSQNVVYIGLEEEDKKEGQYFVNNYPIGTMAPLGNVGYNSIRKTDGSLVFDTQERYKNMISRVFRFPKDGKVCLIQYNVETRSMELVERSVSVQRDLSDIKNVLDWQEFKSPFNGWTFWDSIPDLIDGTAENPQDMLTVLNNQLVARYSSQLCVDKISRHRLGWFLVYWLVNHSTVDAVRALTSGTVDDNKFPAVALLNHAINILDLCIGMASAQNPMVASGMFQPFIRGFVDKPASEWPVTKGFGEDHESLYLDLPDDPNDAMANMLRAHPNTYLVRLSPTTPMHVEFIMYMVKDAERTTTKNRRKKWKNSVVMFRVNMLEPFKRTRLVTVNLDDEVVSREETTNLNQPDCPAPMVYLLFLMVNMLRNENGMPASYQVGMDLLLAKLITQEVRLNETIRWSPIMANFGSAQKYYASLCADPAVSSRNPLVFTDYSQVYARMKQQQQLFQALFLSMFDKERVEDLDTVERYKEYLQTAQFCESMFATLDNYGDPGCSVSSTWMLERIPDEPPNGLMESLFKHVDQFYSGSLWECERTVVRRIGEAASQIPFPGVEEYVSGETAMRRQHMWHLIRWLGIRYFKVALEKPNDWSQRVEKMLKWVLRSSSAYPFASPDMADNMLAELGPHAQKYGFVLRLSTSTPLAFERRTKNPAYKPDLPYMSECLYDVIDVNEWIHWLDGVSPEYIKKISEFTEVRQVFRDIGVKFRWDREIEAQIIDYLVRKNLFKQPRGWVLVRSLRTIEQYLRTCNVDVSARQLAVHTTIWSAFQDATIEEALERLDAIVDKGFPRDASIWREIKGRTIAVNALGEGRVISSASEICRAGMFSRLNFNRLSQPECVEDPNWIFDQPLLTDKFLGDLAKQRKDEDRKVARNVQDTVDYLKAMPAFAANWCTSGRRGDRNLSVAVNWLGYDAIKFIGKMPKPGSDGGFPKPTTPIEMESLIAIRCLVELSADPLFHLLLTPPEADMIANKYPELAVVNLSASRPRCLTVSYVSPKEAFEIQHADIEMSDLIPLYNDEFPIPLLVRLLVYQMFQAHLVPAFEDVTKLDQAGCRKKDQARPTGFKYEFRFKNEVTQQYASQIMAMMLSAATEIDPVRVRQYTDTDRWRRFHPQLAAAQDMLQRPVRFVESIRTGFADAWRSTKTFFYNWNQWWINPQNYLYESNSISGAVFTSELKEVLPVFDDAEKQYIDTHFRPTEIPSLLRKIGASEDEGLLRASLRYRQKEFRGEAFTTEKQEKSFLKDLKASIFGEPKESKETKPGVPDTILNQLRVVKVASPGAAAHLLMQKIQSGEALGPGETKLGMELQVLDAQGKPFQRGPVPQYAPRFVSAGPMSDVSGPPFQEVKDQVWKNYSDFGEGESQESFLKKLEDFETNEGCAANGPDYVFPAFDVDSKGHILPRCGRPGWMSAARTITQDQFDRLDSTNQRLLGAIKSMARHWCPTPEHELRMWRWIGIGCIGRRAVEILASEALERLDDTTLPKESPIKQLTKESRKEQRKMIEEFRRRASREKRKHAQEDVCKKRVLFLQQMISSNILFPYIPDHKNARILAGYNPERVVIMLGWAKSGSVICMRDGRGKFMELAYQAEDLVEYIQYVPTTVRLRVFYDFYGGIAASNYDFYTRVLHQSGQKQCVKSLADMKRFAVRAALSLADQRRLDEVYQAAQQSPTGVTPQQRQELEELQNISLLLQAKNLTATELFIYEEIRKLENLPGNDKQAVELAERLYKSREVDVRLSEAEEFEALALCQRPEFVPYLRKKLKEKYPELTAAQIDAMDRQQLCKALINNPNLEQINMPVLLWQIKDVPDNFRADNGLLDIWTGQAAKRDGINDWLMKNYGITLEQLQKDNQNTYNEEILGQQAERFRDETEQRKQREAETIEDLNAFREFLTNGAKCPYNLEGKNVCEKEYETTDKKSINLLSDSDNMKSKGVLDLFSVIFANFCHPAVPLLMNDFEFILQSFNSLKNYFMLRKYENISSERRLDKQCKIIRSMYNKLMADAETASWRDVPLSEILNQTLIKKYYKALRDGLAKGLQLRHSWTEFALKPRSDDEKVTFAFAVLLLVAEMNGIVTLPSV